MLLTVEEFQSLHDSSLEEDALTILLYAAEQEIIRHAGDGETATALFDGGHRFLALGRPAAAVTSITETRWTTETTLATDDWLLHPSGYLIERLRTGTNAAWRWGGRVAVIYHPVDDLELRKVVQGDLIALAIAYNPGLTSETIGAWSETYGSNSVWNNLTERDAILSRLTEGPGMVVVGDGW